MRYLGENLETSGYRLYQKLNDSKRTRKLLSWIIDKCSKCGRFTSKHGKMCTKCCRRVHDSYEGRREYYKEYYKEASKRKILVRSK